MAHGAVILRASPGQITPRSTALPNPSSRKHNSTRFFGRLKQPLRSSNRQVLHGSRAGQGFYPGRVWARNRHRGTEPRFPCTRLPAPCYFVAVCCFAVSSVGIRDLGEGTDIEEGDDNPHRRQPDEGDRPDFERYRHSPCPCTWETSNPLESILGSDRGTEPRQPLTPWAGGLTLAGEN